MNKVTFSEVFSVLRFPLSVFIVIFHLFNTQSVETSTWALTIYSYIRTFLFWCISDGVVKVFFIMSGFLMLRKIDVMNKENYFLILKKRWVSLALPYLVWNILYLLKNNWNLLQEQGLNIFWDCFWTPSSVPDLLGNDVVSSFPLLAPFWYIRDLIVLTIMIPLLFQLLKKVGLPLLLVIGILYLTRVWIPGLSHTYVTSLLFFSIGGYFAIKKRDVVLFCYEYKAFLVITEIMLLIVTTILKVNDLEPAYSWVSNMSGIFAAALFFIVGVYASRNRNVNAFCAKHGHDGFFIYAFHWFILSYVQRVFSLWGGQNCLIVLAKDVLMPFCCVLICILVHRLILKILPSKFYKLLGDR